MKGIFLFGFSGHACVIADAILSMGDKPEGYFDRQQADSNPFGIPFMGSETETEPGKIVGSQFAFPSVGSNAIRKKLVALFEEQKISQLVIRHASAVVSAHAAIAPSTFVGPGAIVNARATIGKGCIINSKAVIEHDCRIGDFTHIAPGAVLTGNVEVGSESFVGAGAVVRQGQTIGSHSIIGAGSVVISDVPDHETWAGNPARRIK